MIRITAYKDGEALGTGAYDFERVCIGSAEKAHLRVDEEGIAPAHVEVWVEGGKCYARLLSFELAWINGEELEDEIELKPSDRLRVSPQIDFTVVYDGTQTKQDPKKITEVSFKAYSDVADIEDDAPKVPSTPTKSAPRPVAQREEKTAKRQYGIKEKLIVVGMPLAVLFMFWWKVWPVIKKMNGWK